MKQPIRAAMMLALVLALATISLRSAAPFVVAAGSIPEYVGPIYSGSELDYQPSIIRTLSGGQLMVVLERISLPSFSGDFYVTFSNDGGQSWTVPQPALSSPLNERHPSLLQLDDGSFLLFYLVDETGAGAYRLHRATSPDGLTWADQGALDLGWPTPGEINPAVIRQTDGTLTMTYHRLSGPSYIAQSNDNGVTWDTLRTQVSNGNAALPRLAWRESDGSYLVTYQVNPGNNDLDLYAKVSTDPYNWSGPQIPVSTDVNTHDSQPIVLEDGTFLVAYAKAPVNYFDIFYRTSRDGLAWSPEVQVTSDPSHYDTQPHPLRHGTPGRILLTWSHQKSAAPYVDHDVWINTELIVPADLGASSKAAEPAVVDIADVLTYTLRLSNEGYGPTIATLADPIPENTRYLPDSLWASSGSAGYDPVGGVVHWTGMISAGGSITVTFQVSADLGLEDGDRVTNTAWLTDGRGVGYTLTAATTVDALPPASAILDPQDGQWISTTTCLVSGVATDTVSGVVAVAISVDGGLWQPAPGKESWSFLWSNPTDGQHNLRSRAADALGHLEAAGPGITVTVDTTPPQLTAFYPVSGAVDVPLTATVVLTFSEPVVTGTLAYTVAPDPGGWAARWSGDGTVVSLHHASFAPGQSYLFTVTQARDRARNPLRPVWWSFATLQPQTRHHLYLPLVLKDGQ